MIVVTLCRSALKRAGACADGLSLFDAIASQQPASDARRLRRIKVRWTRLHQLWAATAYPTFYGWLRDNGLAPQLSMRHANLRGANLRGADLYGANLGDWERDPATGYALRLDSEAAE